VPQFLSSIQQAHDLQRTDAHLALKPTNTSLCGQRLPTIQISPTTEDNVPLQLEQANLCAAFFTVTIKPPAGSTLEHVYTCTYDAEKLIFVCDPGQENFRAQGDWKFTITYTEKRREMVELLPASLLTIPSIQTISVDPCAPAKLYVSPPSARSVVVNNTTNRTIAKEIKIAIHDCYDQFVHTNRLTDASRSVVTQLQYMVKPAPTMVDTATSTSTSTSSSSVPTVTVQSIVLDERHGNILFKNVTINSDCTCPAGPYELHISGIPPYDQHFHDTYLFQFVNTANEVRDFEEKEQKFHQTQTAFEQYNKEKAELNTKLKQLQEQKQKYDSNICHLHRQFHELLQSNRDPSISFTIPPNLDLSQQIIWVHQRCQYLSHTVQNAMQTVQPVVTPHDPIHEMKMDLHTTGYYGRVIDFATVPDANLCRLISFHFR
jgi:hypothetical protein